MRPIYFLYTCWGSLEQFLRTWGINMTKNSGFAWGLDSRFWSYMKNTIAAKSAFSGKLWLFCWGYTFMGKYWLRGYQALSSSLKCYTWCADLKILLKYKEIHVFMFKYNKIIITNQCLYQALFKFVYRIFK